MGQFGNNGNTLRFWYTSFGTISAFTEPLNSSSLALKTANHSILARWQTCSEDTHTHTHTHRYMYVCIYRFSDGTGAGTTCTCLLCIKDTLSDNSYSDEVNKPRPSCITGNNAEKSTSPGIISSPAYQHIS